MPHCDPLHIAAHSERSNTTIVSLLKLATTHWQYKKVLHFEALLVDDLFQDSKPGVKSSLNGAVYAAFKHSFESGLVVPPFGTSN